MKRNKQMYPVPNSPYLETWESMLVSAAHAVGKPLYLVDAKLPYSRVRLHLNGKASLLETFDSTQYDSSESLCAAIEAVLKRTLSPS